MSTKALTTGWGLTPVFSDFLEPWSDFFNTGMPVRTLTVPKVNVSENDKNYAVAIAAPGMDKKDFKIEMDGNMLTISAQKEENKEQKEEKYTRQEYNYSSFSRSFTLPEEVDSEKIEANYENGVLKLKLPKNGKKQSRKAIAIK